MMNPNYFLAIYVVVLCAVLLLKYYQRFSWQALKTGWVLVILLNIGILFGSYVFFKEVYGYIGSLFLLLFVFAPTILLELSKRFYAKRHDTFARYLAFLASVLHPADGLREYPRYLYASTLQRQGKSEEALNLFQQLASYNNFVGAAARTRVMVMSCDWETILKSYQSEPAEYQNQLLYLRALGETGHLDEMLRHYANFWERLKKLCREEQDWARLIVYAFCGKTEEVKTLFARTLRHSDEDTQHLWLATALLADGEPEQAEFYLNLLKNAENSERNKAYERRKLHPPALAKKVLSTEAIAILELDLKAHANQQLFRRRLRKT